MWIRESQCWDLTLSVTVTGAAWLPLLFTASYQSHGGRLGRLLPCGPAPVSLYPDEKQWGKICFSHCLFYFIIVCDSNFRLGGRLRCGRDKWILHWELCHPVSMADVPPGSSWFLCRNCSHDLHRVGIDIRHVNIISTDSLARREMLIINYWSWHLW